MTGSQDSVRAALLQTDWTGSKDTMIDKHEAACHEAAKQGAQVICFQELFWKYYQIPIKIQTE